MKFRITHRTHYTYSQPVELCHNEAHLQPRATATQSCGSSAVAIDPLPAERHERNDFFGNRVLYFAVQDSHEELVVTANSEVEVTPARSSVEDESPSWEEARQRLYVEPSPEDRMARQFVLDSPLAAATPQVHAFALPSFPPGRPILDAILDLNNRIHREIKYDPKGTTVTTLPSEVIRERVGVCQDFAHLAIACLRSLGLPARYVSGYLETIPPAGKPRLQGADASHAWFSAFVPGVGWLDFDPTNDHMPSELHVTTAWGRDYADVTPLKGVIFGGGDHTVKVSVDMVRVGEDPLPRETGEG
jgi:transglutaminase-like putative cysteine protease